MGPRRSIGVLDPFRLHHYTRKPLTWFFTVPASIVTSHPI
jgi:hypothetical protein